MPGQNTEGKVVKYVISTWKVSQPKKIIISTASERDAEIIAKEMGGKLLYKL